MIIRLGRILMVNKTYKNFNQARAHQWKCDKCGDTFSKYPDLKEHKKEDHSY